MYHRITTFLLTIILSALVVRCGPCTPDDLPGGAGGAGEVGVGGGGEAGAGAGTSGNAQGGGSSACEACEPCEVCQEGECVLAPAGHVCRPPANVCDAAEVCDGLSSECLRDSQASLGAIPHAPGCGLYACDGHHFGCPSSCRYDVDCVGPATCVGGECS